MSDTEGAPLLENRTLPFPVDLACQSRREMPPELGAGDPSAMQATWPQAHQPMPLSEKVGQVTGACALELPWSLLLSVVP